MPKKSENQGCAPPLVLLALVPFMSIINGALLAKLWEWFIADPFGAPYLSVVQAIGVAMVVGFLVFQYNDSEPEHRGWSAVGFTVGIACARYALTLIAALVLVQFR